MNKIDLSIIIVNYKSWDSLTKCLDSFKTFEPKISYEIIVVDNDSRDGKFITFEKQFSQIKFIASEGNYGFSNGCNLGAENADGKFLLFLNPDVILNDSSAIDEMFSFAEANQNVGITSCRTIDCNGRLKREIAFLNPWLTIGWLRFIYRLIFATKLAKDFPKNEKIWYPEWVSGAVVLIQKDFFNRVGKWSENKFWMYSEDPDLCLKVRKFGKEIALLRNVELIHLHGGSSRINPMTTAITKSEVVTSSHVFIQEHFKGINKFALHVCIIINTLSSWLIRTLLTAPFFYKVLFRANLLTLIAIIKYYFGVFIRRSWKSKRLKNNEPKR